MREQNKAIEAQRTINKCNKAKHSTKTFLCITTAAITPVDL